MFELLQQDKTEQTQVNEILGRYLSSELSHTEIFVLGAKNER